MIISIYKRKHIDILRPYECFVFGSNMQGFHGAGAAAVAMYGKYGNLWRDEIVPGQKTTLQHVPDGTKGHWAVKGVFSGFQEGIEGRSYAIPTVVRPGQKRSISLSNIKKSIAGLYEFANKSKGCLFYVAQGASSGYNGYTPHEMATVWFYEQPPSNVLFSEEFVRMTMPDHDAVHMEPLYKVSDTPLTNFHICMNSITTSFGEARSSEALYQAGKFLHIPELASRILKLTPSASKKEARKNKSLINENFFGTAQVRLMEYVIARKLECNPYVMEFLAKLGNRLIVEGNHWHDNFWGDCTCNQHRSYSGKNTLGFILSWLGQIRYTDGFGGIERSFNQTTLPLLLK